MDFKTKPTSRRDIRKYSKVLRMLFHIPLGGPFPVLEALEKLPDIFPGSNYVIVKDCDLPDRTMAQCSQNASGGHTIEIKESVYEGAYEKGIGAFLGFICHEICHVFLFSIGFTPVHARSFSDTELPAYCSVEWQAKALCAETMIPFTESKGMAPETIIQTYEVAVTVGANGSLARCWRKNCSNKTDDPRQV